MKRFSALIGAAALVCAAPAFSAPTAKDARRLTVRFQYRVIERPYETVKCRARAPHVWRCTVLEIWETVDDATGAVLAENELRFHVTVRRHNGRLRLWDPYLEIWWPRTRARSPTASAPSRSPTRQSP